MASATGTYYKYYHYRPSLPAGCVFTVLFGVSALWHVISIARHRTWYFLPVVIGGVCKSDRLCPQSWLLLTLPRPVVEAVGYIARAISNSQGTHPTLAPYVVQTLLLLLAPPLFAATIYMLLGHIILATDAERHSLIRRKYLTKTFVTCDVVCFFLQLAGGYYGKAWREPWMIVLTLSFTGAGLMASTTSSTSSIGSRIVLAGLILQIVIFAFFVTIAVVFHRRLGVESGHRSLKSKAPWQVYMSVLYITCGLILVRNVVRVAEFAEGLEGFLILHEVFLYVFDALPMLGVMATLNIRYLGCLSGGGAVSREDNDVVEYPGAELERVSLQAK